MKKIVWIWMISMLIALLSPFTLTASAEVDPDYWDGTAAEGFAGGSGTEEDPFLIETPEQLAYLQVSVQNGEKYKDKHVKLCRDLYMNDETFTFEPDSGLVKVTDGVNTRYYGTGILGDDSGENVAFDREPSLCGSWYVEANDLGNTYYGTVFEWTPIGYVANTDAGGVERYFMGTFDGAGHTVYGIWVVEATGSNDRGSGLFSFLMGGTVRNLHVDNSLIHGRSYAGGIVGRTHSYNSHIENCSSGATVIAKKYAGGIAGQMYNSPYLIGCENRGLVVSEQYAGGIAGYGRGASYCLNLGAAYGTQSVGGILGSFESPEANAAYSVRYCSNFGRVTANSKNGTVAYGGGICGMSSNPIYNCHNGGYVFGYSYAGGICGMYTAGQPIADCYNTGKVRSRLIAGGIAGKGAVSGSRNDGEISGVNVVGGICGLPSAENCQNTGSVSGDYCVGGIVGEGYAQGCANYGDIDGKNKVGGVIGIYNAGIYSGKDNSKSAIQNCCNIGRVTAEKRVGGIIGEIKKGAMLLACCNTGAVTGAQYVGAVAGLCDADAVIENAYYLKDCAIDTNKVIQAGVGSEDGTPSADGEGLVACTKEQLGRADTFVGFDFTEIWQENANGPILRAEQAHVHTSVEIEEENYFYKNADCTEGVRYHTSCSCGAVLEGIFSVGQGNGHSISEELLINDKGHYHRCEKCYQMADITLHDFSMSHVKVGEKKGWVIFTCMECQYKNSIPFDLPEPEQEPELPPDTQPDPPEEPLPEEPLPEEPKKTAMKLDLRFVLLLTAGVVLGAMGSYGTSVVKNARRAAKAKKKDFM